MGPLDVDPARIQAYARFLATRMATIAGADPPNGAGRAPPADVLDRLRRGLASGAGRADPRPTHGAGRGRGPARPSGPHDVCDHSVPRCRSDLAESRRSAAGGERRRRGGDRHGDLAGTPIVRGSRPRAVPARRRMRVRRRLRPRLRRTVRLRSKADRCICVHRHLHVTRRSTARRVLRQRHRPVLGPERGRPRHPHGVDRRRGHYQGLGVRTAPWTREWYRAGGAAHRLSRVPLPGLLQLGLGERDRTGRSRRRRCHQLLDQRRSRSVFRPRGAGVPRRVRRGDRGERLGRQRRSRPRDRRPRRPLGDDRGSVVRAAGVHDHVATPWLRRRDDAAPWVDDHQRRRGEDRGVGRRRRGIRGPDVQQPDGTRDRHGPRGGLRARERATASRNPGTSDVAEARA